MKRIILAFTALTITTMAFAGRPTGLRLGAGYQMNMYYADVDGTSILGLGGIGFGLDKTEFYGMFIDCGYDWTFSKHSTLCVGARFSAMFNGKFNKNSFAGEKNYNISGQLSHRLYIDIPVQYQYAFTVSPKVKIIVAAGPTINFWLTNGTGTFRSSNTTSKDHTVASHYNWFNESVAGDKFYNKVNLSLGGSAGVIIFDHVKIYMAYDQALFSFTNKDYSKSTLGQLRIGGAYIF